VCHSIVSGWKHSGKEYWDYYRQLATSTQDPPRRAEGSIGAINSDNLFSTVTGYTAIWIKRIAKTKADKEHLLDGVEASRDFRCTIIRRIRTAQENSAVEIALW